MRVVIWAGAKWREIFGTGPWADYLGRSLCTHAESKPPIRSTWFASLVQTNPYVTDIFPYWRHRFSATTYTSVETCLSALYKSSVSSGDLKRLWARFYISRQQALVRKNRLLLGQVLFWRCPGYIKRFGYRPWHHRSIIGRISSQFKDTLHVVEGNSEIFFTPRINIVNRRRRRRLTMIFETVQIFTVTSYYDAIFILLFWLL